MISVVVVHFEAQKIIVDSESFTDMLFYDAFKIVKLLANRLMPVHSPLYGFNGEAIVPKGIITLPMTLGTMPKHLNLMIDFMVIKVPSVYKMVLGRLYMRMEKVVLST